MSKRIDLLRLDYTFSVIVPMLLAIFINNLNPFMHIDIILGFFFLAITGNTWNDVIDMRHPEEIETLERVKGYHPREIFTIGLASFVLGITLLMRTALQHTINAFFLFIIIIMVLVYCKWLKPVPIINQVLLGASHILLPYFMIKIDADLPLMNELEWLMMLMFFSFALTGQLVHEVIDGDAIRKHLSLRQCQIIIQISSVITLVSAFVIFIIFPEAYKFYFIPFLLFPLGTMFTFRTPTESTRGVKDVGILIGNFLLLYFICLIILQMNGII
ncbi:MAG: UbiA family prenyltransferase [Promethearchaeota archaeon]